ncbi:outer membrane beta-barrel protein [Mongoliitalea lutea]|uniref:Outer membrane protein beta-barrel domain-containing protein n=1 Tax=Mongoliitalea lutea TaxID=849756 RepID=A0A8J3G4P4_9BACT|nr:outer membrane beta-barrel protein [Mongoliitalea lutea]GHB29432.1 hypothetical protein GCM10008106_07970 [Mongoliitalea lutea]
MKFNLIFGCVFFLFLFEVKAQLNFGPKVGINTGIESYEQLTEFKDFSWSGSHVGVFGRVDFLFLYVQPELLYSMNQFQSSLINDDGTTSFIDYKTNRVDFPIMAGFRFFKFLRVGAGPIFSVVTSDSSTGMTNNSIGFSNATAGFQVNGGFDIWKLIIDLKYESGAGELADKILGVESDFRPNQFIVSIGIKLF